MANRPQNDTVELLAISRGTDNEGSVNYEPVGRSTQHRVSWRGQKPIVERFWDRVNKFGPIHPDLGQCWQWTGLVVARYGQISLGHPSTPGSKRWKAHRFSWELHNGPIADGLVARHACDNCLCVNPSHLVLGTQKQNVHDSINRGRRNAFGIQKLHPDDIPVIRDQSASGIRQKDIAHAFGVARNTISQIVNGRTWAHVPSSASFASSSAVQAVAGPSRAQAEARARRVSGPAVGRPVSSPSSCSEVSFPRATTV